MNRILQWFQKKEPKVNILMQTVIKYQTFKHDSLKHVFSSDNSILQVYACKDNIEEYIDYIKMINNHLKIDQQLSPILLSFDSHPVYKRDFFVLKNGCYADPIKEYQELATHAVEFLQLYSQKENTMEKSFAMEKNLLLTKHLVNNIVTLIEQL